MGVARGPGRPRKALKALSYQPHAFSSILVDEEVEDKDEEDKVVEVNDDANIVPNDDNGNAAHEQLDNDVATAQLLEGLLLGQVTEIPNTLPVEPPHSQIASTQACTSFTQPIKLNKDGSIPKKRGPKGPRKNKN